LASLSGQIDMLSATNTYLQMRLEQPNTEFAELKTQLGNIQTELEGAQGEKAQLEARLQSQTDDYTALNTRIDDLQAQLAAALTGRDEVEAQLQTRSTEYAEAQTRLAEVTAQLDAVPKDLLAVSVLTNRVVTKRAALTGALIAGLQPVLSPHPQDLSQIGGIGTVFEKRLFAAGVGSFWEVANLTNAEFEQILGLDEFQLQTFRFDDIRAKALHLAQNTNTVGLIWEGQQVDDFDAIEGMGTVFEQKLYAAGIYTYAALAKLTVEQLSEICHAPRLRIPDYAHWLTQAQQLTGEQPQA